MVARGDRTDEFFTTWEDAAKWIDQRKAERERKKEGGKNTKYHVYSKSKITGRVSVLMTKCTDRWCSETYLANYPDRVWQFSESGAKKIVERNTAEQGWNYEYWMSPAT